MKPERESYGFDFYRRFTLKEMLDLVFDAIWIYFIQIPSDWRWIGNEKMNIHSMISEFNNLRRPFLYKLNEFTLEELKNT